MEDTGMIENCDINDNSFTNALEKDRSIIFSEAFLKNREQVLNQTCISDNKKRIAHYTKEQQAQPAKDYQEKATEEDYTFCLQKNGL